MAEDAGFWSTCNTLLWVLGFAAALVELRTIFRLVEACVGFFGESAPVALACWLNVENKLTRRSLCLSSSC